jgi:hypothetical protein
MSAEVPTITINTTQTLNNVNQERNQFTEWLSPVKWTVDVNVDYNQLFVQSISGDIQNYVNFTTNDYITIHSDLALMPGNTLPPDDPNVYDNNPFFIPCARFSGINVFDYNYRNHNEEDLIEFSGSGNTLNHYGNIHCLSHIDENEHPEPSITVKQTEILNNELRYFTNINKRYSDVEELRHIRGYNWFWWARKYYNVNNELLSDRIIYNQHDQMNRQIGIKDKRICSTPRRRIYKLVPCEEDNLYVFAPIDEVIRNGMLITNFIGRGEEQWRYKFEGKEKEKDKRIRHDYNQNANDPNEEANKLNHIKISFGQTTKNNILLYNGKPGLGYKYNIGLHRLNKEWKLNVNDDYGLSSNNEERIIVTSSFNENDNVYHINGTTNKINVFPFQSENLFDYVVKEFNLRLSLFLSDYYVETCRYSYTQNFTEEGESHEDNRYIRMTQHLINMSNLFKFAYNDNRMNDVLSINSSVGLKFIGIPDENSWKEERNYSHTLFIDEHDKVVDHPGMWHNVDLVNDGIFTYVDGFECLIPKGSNGTNFTFIEDNEFGDEMISGLSSNTKLNSVNSNGFESKLILITSKWHTHQEMFWYKISNKKFDYDKYYSEYIFYAINEEENEEEEEDEEEEEKAAIILPDVDLTQHIIGDNEEMYNVLFNNFEIEYPTYKNNDNIRIEPYKSLFPHDGIINISSSIRLYKYLKSLHISPQRWQGQIRNNEVNKEMEVFNMVYIYLSAFNEKKTYIITEKISKDESVQWTMKFPEINDFVTFNSFIDFGIFKLYPRTIYITSSIHSIYVNNLKPDFYGYIAPLSNIIFSASNMYQQQDYLSNEVRNGVFVESNQKIRLYLYDEEGEPVLYGWLYRNNLNLKITLSKDVKVFTPQINPPALYYHTPSGAPTPIRYATEVKPEYKKISGKVFESGAGDDRYNNEQNDYNVGGGGDGGGDDSSSDSSSDGDMMARDVGPIPRAQYRDIPPDDRFHKKRRKFVDKETAENIVKSNEEKNKEKADEFIYEEDGRRHVPPHVQEAQKATEEQDAMPVYQSPIAGTQQEELDPDVEALLRGD